LKINKLSKITIITSFLLNNLEKKKKIFVEFKVATRTSAVKHKKTGTTPMVGIKKSKNEKSYNLFSTYCFIRIH
jgi:hypothetical protein